MVNYSKMYFMLFNSITDALESMQQHNYGFARFTLEEAQQKAEALFIESEEDDMSADPRENGETAGGTQSNGTL